MKVLFMGTPDFAVPSLKALRDSGHEICAVITQPDRPAGRGMKLMPPEVKVCAEQYDIPVYQPTKIKNDALMPLLEQYQPEVIVVVAYGRILPKYILDFPRYGCINVHGSLLPKYRGAAPIQWAVLNGDEKAGVCTMFMEEGLDTGDIIERVETPIGEEETTEELFDRLAQLGAKAIASTLDALSENRATRTKQNEAEASYARMISREDGVIDWTESDVAIRNRIRGCYSWPIATTKSGDTRIKIYHAENGEPTKAEPGTVLAVDERGMLVAAGNRRSVRITMLQFPNAKRMSPADYFRGHASLIGAVLGEKDD